MISKFILKKVFLKELGKCFLYSKLRLWLILSFLTPFIVRGQVESEVSSSVLEKIRDFRLYEDSLIEKNKNENKVIIVDFYRSESDGNCYMKISSSLVYFACCLKGALLLDDELIAFYDWRSYCSTGFVASNFDSKKGLKRFKSFENSSNIPPHLTTFIKYKITGLDTLEFVERGIE